MTRSILSNWFGLLVIAASTALLTPMMVHHLGAVDYGIWVLAGSVLDYYGLLDLGMRSAMFRYVSLFRGGSAREEIDRTFNSALILVTITAALISVLSVVIAYLLPYFVRLNGATPSTYHSLLLLLGLSIAVMFPTRMLATYISAHNRWDLYNAAGIANTVTRAIAVVLVLKLGYGILALAAATLSVSLLSLLQHVLLVRVADPAVCVNYRWARVGRIRELLAFSMRSFLVSLGDYLRFYSDSAVIAVVMSVGLVTPFNIATRLIESFRSIVIAAGGPVLGSMTELDGARRESELRHFLLRSTRLLALLSVLGGVLLLVDGRALLRLWVGEPLVSAYPLIAILAFGYMITLTQHAALLIVISKGQHGPLGWWTIAEGAANIALSIVWGRSYGLVGVAFGTIVPMLIVKVFIQLRYALKACRMNVSDYLRGGMARPLVVAALFWLAAAAISRAYGHTFAAFAGNLVSQCALFAVLSWGLGLTGNERRWIAARALQRISSVSAHSHREFIPQDSPADLA